MDDSRTKQDKTVRALKKKYKKKNAHMYPNIVRRMLMNWGEMSNSDKEWYENSAYEICVAASLEKDTNRRQEDGKDDLEQR